MTQSPNLDDLAEEMLGVFRMHRLERRTRTPIDSITMDEAYDVQDRVIAARVRDGEEVAGYKVGCTSAAVRAQFGLDQPIAGRLMRPHVHEDGVALDIDDFVDCAVEPELVIHIGNDLDDPGVGDDDLRAAIAGVAAGVEIHNYRFFHGAPTSQELIASNGIHAALVTGASRPLGDVDLAMQGVGLFRNGELVTSAICAEILGRGPLASLRWLMQHLIARGQRLRPGMLVIPGSPVGLVSVSAGDDIETRITDFGSCRVSFR